MNHSTRVCTNDSSAWLFVVVDSLSAVKLIEYVLLIPGSKGVGAGNERKHGYCAYAKEHQQRGKDGKYGPLTVWQPQEEQEDDA